MRRQPAAAFTKWPAVVLRASGTRDRDAAAGRRGEPTTLVAVRLDATDVAHDPHPADTPPLTQMPALLIIGEQLSSKIGPEDDLRLRFEAAARLAPDDECLVLRAARQYPAQP